jgi:hypothetical protein
LSKVMA